MIKIRWSVILLGLATALVSSVSAEQIQLETKSGAPIRVGWIGSMSGPVAKWGAYQAAQLAQDEVNAAGGINGRRLEILFEDAHADGKTAVSAFQKLTSVDRVSAILGGHCTPESLAIAPLAERMKIPMIASITSTPKLTNAGDFIFRVTPVSTKLADVLVPYAYHTIGARKIAIFYETTDYATPPAERVRDLFQAAGGTVTSFDAFSRDEVDFRSLLIRAAARKPDAIYFGTQTPDTAILFVQQVRQLGLSAKLLANEQVAGAIHSATDASTRHLFDHLVFAEPTCDLSSPETAAFAKKYSERFHVAQLPFGCYTAEPYDTVKLIARALAECGERGECIKEALYRTKDFNGASGRFSFDLNGDVSRAYVLKAVVDGEIRVSEGEGK